MAAEPPLVRLVLVRHAIAEERDHTRWPDDGLRPLSARGTARFVAAARGLEALAPAPSLVLTSPYVRAMETAQLLTAHAGWPPALEAASLASGSSRAVAKAIRALGDIDSLGLVGHEPNLSHLASWLLAAHELAIEFDWRKGGVAVLETRAFRPGAARLVAFAPPKNLRTLAKTD